MRIGILPNVAQSSGGIYQYSLTILHVLDQWKNNGGEDHFVLFTNETTPPAVATVINGDGWTIKPLQRPTLPLQALSILRRIVGEGLHRKVWRRLRSAMSPSPIQQQPVSMDPDGVRY